MEKTKKTIKNRIKELMVDLWSHKNNFGRPTTQVDDCEHCGRKVGKNPRYVHVMTSGVIVPNDITEEDIDLIGNQSQGCFPIGENCAKKLFSKKVDEYTFRYK